MLTVNILLTIIETPLDQRYHTSYSSAYNIEPPSTYILNDYEFHTNHVLSSFTFYPLITTYEPSTLLFLLAISLKFPTSYFDISK